MLCFIHRSMILIFCSPCKRRQKPYCLALFLKQFVPFLCRIASCSTLIGVQHGSSGSSEAQEQFRITLLIILFPLAVWRQQVLLFKVASKGGVQQIRPSISPSIQSVWNILTINNFICIQLLLSIQHNRSRET